MSEPDLLEPGSEIEPKRHLNALYAIRSNKLFPRRLLSLAR